ncbi:MAG: hypothetical protein SCK29_08545 [Bacillota bacterium]|nr:hypothetical protein [Bacillota bacterium]
MTVLMLVIVNILLVTGMVFLPPVTGGGLGSIVARAWLAFGVLILLGHYYHFLEESDRRKARRAAAEFKAHRRFVRSVERSAAHK